MKLAFACVTAVLLSGVSGHEWFARRDAESGSFTACKNLFAPVVRILQQQRFRYLIEDGQLSLDCSQQTMSRAEGCRFSDEFACYSRYPPDILFIVLNTFCSHRTEIEDDASCWTSDRLPGAFISCSRQSSSANFANCVQGSVTNLTECSSGRTGAILRQLVLDVRA
ncbi:uncharacterized protein LOC124274550 [Haliotis rubra]|uniref:uncharacterized protein LOC124274550 n=1 Tax=Haliotis rubra TaxID=36100 RepID=UPI001EE5855C|nr:uncharacterized protein LOC124274550 [Haliotis rubra]